MAIVTQTDKRSGITYAYETTYYWDKEKQLSRSKRTCIGKVDPATGDIIPTRGRAKKGRIQNHKECTRKDRIETIYCFKAALLWSCIFA